MRLTSKTKSITEQATYSDGQIWNNRRGFLGGAVVKNPLAKSGDARDAGLISGLGNPLE